MLCENCVQFMFERFQKDRRYMVAAYIWSLFVDIIMTLFIYCNFELSIDILWCLPLLLDLMLGGACLAVTALRHMRQEKLILRVRYILMLSQLIIGFMYFGWNCLSVLSAITFIILCGIWVYRIRVLNVYIAYIKNLTIAGGI